MKAFRKIRLRWAKASKFGVFMTVLLYTPLSKPPSSAATEKGAHKSRDLYSTPVPCEHLLQSSGIVIHKSIIFVPGKHLEVAGLCKTALLTGEVW